jgi:predicted nucleic acid-binding protein
MTHVELCSAVERRAREGRLGAAERRRALDGFDELAKHWHEVVDVLSVRMRARSLLARHPLRAADAAQLGAALLAAEDVSSGEELVCLDRGLAAAAEREGFRVLTWPAETLPR